jgi:hypothetical protein
MFRSPGVDLISLGVEGFVDPASLTFIKDAYMVKLVGYDESVEMSLAMTNLAEEIAALITGVVEPPDEFDRFPVGTVVATADKFYAESYLGQKFLTDIFTRDYVMNDDTVSLFYADDETGAKYLEWAAVADKSNKKEPAPEGMTFDSDYGFVFDDSFYGPILVGLKGDKMFGMVGFDDDRADFFRQWLGDSAENKE